MTQPNRESLVLLLDKARDGDTTARDELFERCRNYLAFVARAQAETWLQRKVDASDIVQQTMLEAHQAFEQFRGQSEQEWLAWLKRILNNNAADFVRHYKGAQKRDIKREIPMHREVNGEQQVFEPTAPIDSPSQLVMQNEDEIQLADAIAQLSDDHQEVIMLRNVQRLPFDEVADRMGRSRPAAQMLWMRAIKRLQQLMKNYDAPE